MSASISLVLSIVICCQTPVMAIKTHFVFWNTTNPIFRLDNTDNVIDVNVGNLPWEYDQLNLICPQNTGEQHVIYSVPKEDFDTCRVSDHRPTIVAICNKPQKFQYFTITFRNFSPTPGGLEFKPGQNYYLISTSTTRDIHRRVGGYCSSHNMKMIFKVADNEGKSNDVSSSTVEEEFTPEVEIQKKSSPFMRAVKPTLSSTYYSTPSSSSSIPIYYYRSRNPTEEPKEYNYYYSPRDMIKLRKAILDRTEENETLKAEKLLSSSVSLSSFSSLLISLTFGFYLLHLG